MSREVKEYMDKTSGHNFKKYSVYSLIPQYKVSIDLMNSCCYYYCYFLGCFFFLDPRNIKVQVARSVFK